jgi:integrase
VPRRRHQQGRVYLRGKSWVGTYRTYDINPETGRRTRRTITFDESVTSERAAQKALEPYLAEYNARAEADNKQRLPARGGKKLSELVEEWRDKILPGRKYGGARACASHIRTYIKPQLGDIPLRELTPSRHQDFVTAVGQRTGRRRTVENVYATLSSILDKGRKWGYTIPEVKRSDIEFPADLKPKTQTLLFDADTAARIINAAQPPFKLMFLIAAVCGLRIGEVTALKITSLDFKRKLILITAALDYATRKETTPKSKNSASPVVMPDLLAKRLHDWIEKHYKPNAAGYLFTNSIGKPYRSDRVVRDGVHRTIKKLGIETAKGVHVGIHCFRHGVTTELLESGTPIHVVTRMMRHGDSKVTLDHYAHIVGDAERVASERLSTKLGAQLESEPELESVSTKFA